jgi:hypothetical protein
MSRLLSTALVLALTASTSLGGQARPGASGLRAARQDSMPKGFEPPPGMCRVWVDGVPPERQPAPTECSTAVRNRPNNARVIFGPDADSPAARARARLTREEPDGRTDPSTRRDPVRPSPQDEDFMARLKAGDICIDRNHDGRCDDTATGTDGCRDANRDGRCDDARYDLNYVFGGAQGAGQPRAPTVPPGAQARGAYGGTPPAPGDYRMGSAIVPNQQGLGNVFCFDRNHDGRCDEPWADGLDYPQTLPEMDAASRLRRGEASYDLQRWLHRTDLTPRITRSRSGGPNGPIERITWLDQKGEIVQVWTDRDLDGIADRVEIYAGGRRVQIIER